MKLIALCTSMIPFSMIDNVDTTLTPYARKFPALHSREIFYDDEKRRYSIGDRTRRDVDTIAARLEDTKCRQDREIIKHCIRVRIVCGEKVDMYSSGQLIVSPQHYVQPELPSGNDTEINIQGRSGMKKDLNAIQGKVSKAIEKIRALTEIGQRSMNGFHLNDHPLKNAVSVVGAAAPYEVTIKNALAKCSAIRIRWWKYHCHDCLIDGEILG